MKVCWKQWRSITAQTSLLETFVVDKTLHYILTPANSTKVAHPRIYERMEALEAQKSEAEIELARLRIASEICITEEEVYAWLQNFRHGDPHDPAFREKIIDTFINTIYIYDNKIVIFYNIRGGRSTHPVNFADLAATHPELNSSDLLDDAPRMAFKFEPHYIFVNKTLGCVIWRNRDAE